jgi:hypothetical protein
VYGTRNGAPWVIDGLAFRDNLMKHNTYGVKGDALAVGQQTLTAYFTGLVFERNVLADGPAAAYPAGNFFPSEAEFMAAFVNTAAGDFSLVPNTPFRTAASDGGSVGADIARVTAVGSGPAAATPAATGISPRAHHLERQVWGVPKSLSCPAADPYFRRR